MDAQISKTDVLQALDISGYYSRYISDLGKPGPDGWTENSRCPFHEEKNGSFGVNINTGAYRCFGCDAQGDLFKFHMSQTGLDFQPTVMGLASMAGLNGQENLSPSFHHYELGTPDKVYPYYDEHGHVLYYICRFSQPGKEFRPCDPAGKWKVKGTRSVPYNLQKVMQVSTVFISEGEKDADNITRLGFIATCKANWTGKWSQGFAQEFFAGKTIYITQDADQAGHDKALDAAEALKQAPGTKIKILPPFGDQEKYDVSDWIQDGGTKEQLLNIVDQTEWFCDVDDTPKIKIISLADIIKLDPQLEAIAEGIINRGEGVILHAAGGVGKSTIVHQIAEELAMPFNMLSNMLLETFPIRQPGCQSLFIQSENSMPAVNAKSRSCDPEIASKIFYPYIYDDILTTGGSFDDPEFIQLVIDTIKQVEDQTCKRLDLLFVDPLISYHRAEENGAGDMRAALDGITQVAQKTNVTPIVLHHDRKDGDDYRGSTAINDWCRCRVHLKRVWIGEDRITGLGPYNQPIMRTAKVPAIEIHHEKANNMAQFEPVTMVLNKRLKFIKVDDPMDPDVKEKGMAVQQALKDVGGFAESNLTLARAVSELTGKGTSTCKGYITQAVNYGLIKREVCKAIDGKGDAYNYVLI